MKTILHLDSSATLQNSVSRRLTAGFVSDWLGSHPGDTAKYRDLNAEHIPVVTSDLLEALYSPPGTALTEKTRNALALSDALVDEFLSADHYVFGVPMYNFTVPGAFKAYIDQVVRVGKTMARGPKGMEGLMQGRKLLIVSTRAGDYSKGGPRAEWDFHEPYLRRVFGWMGFDDITYVPVMNSRNPEEQEKRVAEAQLILRATAARWQAEREAKQDADRAEAPGAATQAA